MIRVTHRVEGNPLTNLFSALYELRSRQSYFGQLSKEESDRMVGEFHAGLTNDDSDGKKLVEVVREGVDKPSAYISFYVLNKNEMPTVLRADPELANRDVQYRVAGIAEVRQTIVCELTTKKIPLRSHYYFLTEKMMGMLRDEGVPV